MQRRQITLEDGRYLVFYTFEEETASPSNSGAGASARGDDVVVESSDRREEPVAEPQATEERRV
jgi:hypothetical protein